MLIEAAVLVHLVNDINVTFLGIVAQEHVDVVAINTLCAANVAVCVVHCLLPLLATRISTAAYRAFRVLNGNIVAVNLDVAFLVVPCFLLCLRRIGVGLLLGNLNGISIVDAVCKSNTLSCTDKHRKRFIQISRRNESKLRSLAVGFKCNTQDIGCIVGIIGHKGVCVTCTEQYRCVRMQALQLIILLTKWRNIVSFSLIFLHVIGFIRTFALRRKAATFVGRLFCG